MSKWKRYGLIALPVLAIVAIAGVGAWGYQQYTHKQQYRTYLESMVQRSMYELVDGMGNLEVNLGKLLVSDQPAGNARILSDIERVADRVQDNLGQLPMDHQSLSDAMKFASQLGDYCLALEKRVNDGSPLSNDDRTQLQALTAQCATLNTSLQSAVNQGVTLDVYAPAYGVGPAAPESTTSATLTEPGLEYPTLIYDGPFSDAAQTRKPKDDLGGWIDYYQAVSIATAYVGENRVKELVGSAPYSGDVPAWGVEIITQQDDKIAVYVTKQGGRVMWMLQESGTHAQVLTLEQCQQYAQVFLESRGYEGMTPNYSQYYNGIAVLNFAASQDGVVLYPDLVKVQVSMQTGDVIGVEARNYIYNHIRRTDLTPTIDVEQAKALAGQLAVDGYRLCVIPMPDRSERLVWEVTGLYNDERYLVYVNAHNGNEENIIKIIDTENGALTM